MKIVEAHMVVDQIHDMTNTNSEAICFHNLPEITSKDAISTLGSHSSKINMLNHFQPLKYQDDLVQNNITLESYSIPKRDLLSKEVYL